MEETFTLTEKDQRELRVAVRRLETATVGIHPRKKKKMWEAIASLRQMLPFLNNEVVKMDFDEDAAAIIREAILRLPDDPSDPEVVGVAETLRGELGPLFGD